MPKFVVILSGLLFLGFGDVLYDDSELCDGVVVVDDGDKMGFPVLVTFGVD